MLPEVTLNNVSRGDVDRIAWWLEASELSSRWFGHYGCGDPVHRGYDPQHMLEASEREWARVFNDPLRLIYSIFSETDAHIGECQLLLDGDGGAEISLLIGRKPLWHRGYGTSTVIELLEKVFVELGLKTAWVSVPDDNTPAQGLFEKLGFVFQARRDLCTRPDGSILRAGILSIEASTYLARRSGEGSASSTDTVITVTGLPGSGSQEIGREVARITGSLYVDQEIRENVCLRLRCSPGELETFEAGHRSFWSRLLHTVALPTEWSATYDAGYQWYAGKPVSEYSGLLEDQITRQQYTQALSGVVRGLAVGGNVVLHGNGSHFYVPPKPGTINVFVLASHQLRQQRVMAEELLESEVEAEKWIKAADGELTSHYQHLLGFDLMDISRYDVNVNLDRMSIETAAQIVARAVRVEVVERAPIAEVPAAAAVAG